MSATNCSYCKKEVAELIRLDDHVRKELATGLNLLVPEAVCSSCVDEFNKRIQIHHNRENRRAEKEQSRMSLWRRRVEILREGRTRFAAKDFPGAVVAYEKYLRVVEMIYDVKPNHLKVSFFNNSARSKELVLLASTYWDLVRIYDQSDRFSKRFQECSEKLIEFLPFTPVYSEILHKIDDYKKNAKHKDVFQKMVKQVQKKKKRCFIATAAFEDGEHPTVQKLCVFRDTVLKKSPAGRGFIDAYYYFSPAIAEVLDEAPFLRIPVKTTLDHLAIFLDRKYHLK